MQGLVRRVARQIEQCRNYFWPRENSAPLDLILSGKIIQRGAEV